MDKKELIDFLEEFRAGLISKATDGTIDEAVYSANRDKLINIKEIKDYIPIFIKTQRSAELFRKYMQRHEHYKERREEINEAFNRMIYYVEFDENGDNEILKIYNLNDQCTHRGRHNSDMDKINKYILNNNS